MKKTKAPESPSYSLFLRPSVHKARKSLPGKVRQKIARSLDRLGRDPRPAKSKELRLPEGQAERNALSLEVRRLRLEDYRVVYAISERWQEIYVLAIEKRPPYSYQDLERLLADLAE